MVDAAGLDAVLPQTDLLVIAVPDTPETKNLVDPRRLELVPAGGVVVNIGRGAVPDEGALTGSWGPDGFVEPPSTSSRRSPSPRPARWDMPNVIISPHSASTVVQENDRLVDLFIENLHRYLDGRPLINVFDHGRRY